MKLSDLFQGFEPRVCKRDIQTKAQVIVTRYHQGKARGELRVDEKLSLELTQIIPDKVAQRILCDFRNRRAHTHPNAEGILLQEIMTTLLDAEHFAKTSKPVVRPPEPQPITGTTLKEQAEAKVLAGQPLTDAEEDAMLWS